MFTGSKESMLPRHTGANIGSLCFIEHPALVLRVVGVFLTKVVADDLPGSMLVGITEFSREFHRFIGSHSSEHRPRPGYPRNDG